MAVDQDGGRAEAVRAEMSAEEFDFAEGQRGGGHDVVDAGIAEGSGGLGGRLGIKAALRRQNQRRSKAATPKAYSPAATSSKTMPQPSGRLSS